MIKLQASTDNLEYLHTYLSELLLDLDDVQHGRDFCPLTTVGYKGEPPFNNTAGLCTTILDSVLSDKDIYVLFSTFAGYSGDENYPCGDRLKYGSVNAYHNPVRIALIEHIINVCQDNLEYRSHKRARDERKRKQLQIDKTAQDVLNLVITLVLIIIGLILIMECLK